MSSEPIIIQLGAFNTELLALKDDGSVWLWNPNIKDWVEFGK